VKNLSLSARKFGCLTGKWPKKVGPNQDGGGVTKRAEVFRGERSSPESPLEAETTYGDRPEAPVEPAAKGTSVTSESDLKFD